MSHLGTRLATASLLLLVSASHAAAQATFRACAQPSQFIAADCQDSGPTTAPVALSKSGTANVDGDPARATAANATAGSYALSAEASATNTGITVSQARAQWTAAFIEFAPSQTLLGLLEPGETQVELFMNFTATTSLSAPAPAAVFRQAVATVFGSIAGSGLGYFHDVNGTAQIQNGPFEHTFTNGGFLSGLPEEGGTVSFAFPIRLTPGASNGLRINFSAIITSSTLSLSPPTSAAIWLSLVEGEGAITLADGTPVSQLGISYTFTPAQALPPVATVPEPGTWMLVASGLVLIAARTSQGGRRRRT